MIQFNLLPDVKLQYIKATRTKRLVVNIALLVGITSLFIMAVLLLSVHVFQKKSISDLDKDITKYSDELKATPDLTKILTVQNQLGALTGLHDQDPTTSRVFKFMEQLTPSDSTISKLDVDYSQSLLTVTGDAPSLDVVNTYVDTLKFTSFKTSKESEDDTKAFSNVVLSNFGRSQSGANYTISLNFDPAIFSNENSIQLSVPNIVSTRSSIEQPTEIFKQPSNGVGGQ